MRLHLSFILVHLCTLYIVTTLIMGLHRKNVLRGATSSMFTRRTGGRVTLFNYNPSVAGGRVGLGRYKSAHHKGRFMRHKEHERTVATVGTGGGLTSPGTAGRGVDPGFNINRGNYAGLGATGRTAMHPVNETRKRIHDLLASKLDGGGKRARM